MALPGHGHNVQLAFSRIDDDVASLRKAAINKVCTSSVKPMREQGVHISVREVMTTVKRPPLRIPRLIRRSTLMRQGGFATYDGLLNDRLFPNLLHEALSRYEMAAETHTPASDGEDWRGGSPARRFLSVVGGPIQTAF